MPCWEPRLVDNRCKVAQLRRLDSQRE
jgi:hypothetical protein